MYNQCVAAEGIGGAVSPSMRGGSDSALTSRRASGDCTATVGEGERV